MAKIFRSLWTFEISSTSIIPGMLDRNGKYIYVCARVYTHPRSRVINETRAKKMHRLDERTRVVSWNSHWLTRERERRKITWCAGRMPIGVHITYLSASQRPVKDSSLVDIRDDSKRSLSLSSVVLAFILSPRLFSRLLHLCVSGLTQDFPPPSRDEKKEYWSERAHGCSWADCILRN